MGSFMDDFGENVSGAAKDVGEKAKELGECAKLYAYIKAEEVKIQEQNYKLGKKYYSLFQSQAADELIAYVNSINTSNEKIAAYKEELAKNTNKTGND